MLTDLPFDLFILLLRVVFIFLLYFFLYQVVRVVTRELQMAPTVAPRASGPAAPSLTLVDPGPSKLPVGAVYPLRPSTTIGRTDENTVVLPDAFVSSRHARLEQTNGRWYVADLGSTNGTFVNDRPAGTSPQPVQDGDIIQIGRVKLRLALT
jgi:pSer/pThr/pTyr-binding forkhead associated (FHA) protein